jgi:hypothetical protein
MKRDMNLIRLLLLETEAEDPKPGHSASPARSHT